MPGSRMNDERGDLSMGLQTSGQSLGKGRRRPKRIVTARDKDDFRTAAFDGNCGGKRVPGEAPQTFLEKAKVVDGRQTVHRKQRFCLMRHEWEG